MNDNAIKNYATWARRELIAEVEKRCVWWGISEGTDPEADTIDGRVLTAQERKQRRELLEALAADGRDALVERAAYTWFNRLLAIRFMEVNDRLPSHVRVFSSPDGSFEPQCLAEALGLRLDAFDGQEALRLVQEGDDEALFRLVFLAQCAELAECMPAVFEPVGSAMELLLPTGLLRQDGVVGRLVTDIDEDDWHEGVEIVGWLYQYYVSERKDEVFASFKKGKKAERDAIAPATQLFTPHWIVRYLTENSLGRLWMLNRPDSMLVEQMPYFVKPDEEHETEFRRISSPEDITVVDPACGSGHILVYAFDLLAAMYAEAGYRDRDAARLIIEKNLTGLEIDPRAAAMASFALTMRACELDKRFLRRGVVPRVTVLKRVELTDEELEACPNVAKRKALVDVAAHLDECGSLFKPEEDDLDAIERDLASLAGGASLFAGAAADKLGRLRAELEPLAARYDVVVANPPYMGSSSLNRWEAAWAKKHYPEEYRDLCTCFIERGFSLCNGTGSNAMITMQSWMFLGSYERMREKLLRERSISSMAHLGTRAFGAIAGEVVSTTATVFSAMPSDARGAYFRLVDMAGEEEKREGYLEALANPECGWFYRRDASAFEAIPGSPIAYWISDSFVSSFSCNPLRERIATRVGMATADNDMFMRCWWEICIYRLSIEAHDRYEAMNSRKKWFPYNKGGDFRKWYGNRDYVVDWYNDGEHIRSNIDKTTGRIKSHNYNDDYAFLESISWSYLSSSYIHVRYCPTGSLFDSTAGTAFSNKKNNLIYAAALINSSCASAFLGVLAPTMAFKQGEIEKLPDPNRRVDTVARITELCIRISRKDWDSLETSWDFKRHTLV